MTSASPGYPVTTSLPCPRPDGRSLIGQHCRLERSSPAHAPALFAAFSADPDGFTYLFEAPFKTEAAFTDWLRSKAAEQDPFFYSVFINGTPTGLMALMRIVPEHGVIEIGNIHFSAAMRRSRAATEAQYLAMRHAFEDLGYRRYEWKCNALNTPSIAAAKRLGFTYEGTFRQHMVVKGANRDTAWFALLDQDWPIQKTRFETWLSAENFDQNGHQRRGLETF